MHVVAEDIGITMGFAFQKLVETRFSKGIDGCGTATGIIDEANSTVSISFEGRSLYQVLGKDKIRFGRVEDTLSKDLENLLSGFAQGGRCTIHVNIVSEKTYTICGSLYSEHSAKHSEHALTATNIGRGPLLE